MTAAPGVNLPPLDLPQPDIVLDSGTVWGRIPLWTGVNHYDVTRLRQAQVRMLGVIDSAALAGMDDRAAAGHVLQEWGANLDALQVGNESDVVAGEDTGSSSSLSAPRLSTLLQAFREARDRLAPHLLLIVSGMASGNPTYLDTVDLRGYHAIGVHPYAKDALAAADLVAQYHRRFGLPIWVTEYQWSVERSRALRSADFVEAVIMYCWRAWVGWPDALFDPSGQKTFRYAEYKREAGGPRQIMPEFHFGNLDYVKGYGQYAGHPHPEVGEPIEDEEYIGNRSFQITTNGMLVYSKQGNRTQFLPKG